MDPYNRFEIECTRKGDKEKHTVAIEGPHATAADAIAHLRSQGWEPVEVSAETPAAAPEAKGE